MNEFETAGIILIGAFGFIALYCAKKLVDEVEESMEDWEPEKGKKKSGGGNDGIM